jgi:diguanylate cyclase (GGDEF)-like protein
MISGLRLLMNLHIAKLPKLILERRSSAILGLIIIAMLWTGVFLKYLGDVQTDQREAERTTQTYARVFEENVLRSVGEIDKVLLYLRRGAESRSGAADYDDIVNATDVLSDIIVQVAIVDANGIIRASNATPEPSPNINVSDREHFIVHQKSDQDVLFISKPVIGRASGKWSIQVTRRLSNPDHSFAGIVVGSLDASHFTKFYDKIDFGSALSFALIGTDGVVRSSVGGTDRLALGEDISDTQMFDRMKAGTNATFETVEPYVGLIQLRTLRKVQDYPLWVSVSIDKGHIYKASMAAFRLNAAVGSVLTLIILAGMELLLRSETKAGQKAEQLRLTLEHMSQGIMLVTKDLQIPIINGRCGELLDLPAEFIKDPPRFDELAEYQAANSVLRHGALLNLHQSAEVAEPGTITEQIAVCERKMPNGTIIEVRTGHLPDGSFVQTFTDVTKRAEAEAHVARMASEDPLTGLPNRRVFRSALDQISRQYDASAGQSAAQTEFAVFFLDLDSFKVVNDTIGHLVGDLLLQEVSKRLQGPLRQGDVLARLGGDEFAIVVPGVTDHKDLEALADALIEAVISPYEISGHQIRSSISIGIAIGPRDGKDAEDLLMAADLALYAVKAVNRGTYRFHESSMNKELNDRRQIEFDLRTAIENNQLELFYQPVVNTRSNSISGFEALARWRHPIKGMVPPMLFIPVAEDSGLIVPLGEWALREACRQAVRWPSELKIAVNLSPVQFKTSNLVEVVKEILDETGLAPHRLELEITERIFMADNENTLSTLRRLKAIGVRIAMDDFGTGYSSLSYLRSFPFDKIKVDRAFVSDLAERNEHVVIVQAVVSIARALGMTTTAEGVENVGQYEFLKALGCDEVQGYLFSPPVSLDRLDEMFATWTPGKVLAA